MTSIVSLRALPNRSRNVALGVVLSLLLLVPATNSAGALAVTPAPVGTTTTFDLANGLRVVVIEDHRVPVVTHMVWYKVGSIDDPPGKSGLAHLLEHLMFKSFDEASDETFAEKISALGATDNARTAHDATYYFQRVAREGLKDVMALEAKRMSGLTLTEAQVMVERKVVREERRSNVEGDPIKLLTEQIMATLYQNHSYGRPPIGWAHEITRLTLADALRAYSDFYIPANAILIVAGDVTPDAVRQLANDTYGRIAVNREPPNRLETQEPDSIAARRVTVADRRVPQPSIFRHYLAPSHATAATGEAEAIEVLMQILGEGPTSRLYRALVTDADAALAVGSRYFSEGRDSGRIAVLAVAKRGGDLTEVERLVDAVIKKLLADGVSADEVESAKARLEAKNVIESDDQMTLAVRYGEALVTGQTVEDVARRADLIQAVTADDINAAARKFFELNRSVTGLLVPEDVR